MNFDSCQLSRLAFIAYLYHKIDAPSFSVRFERDVECRVTKSEFLQGMPDFLRALNSERTICSRRLVLDPTGVRPFGAVSVLVEPTLNAIGRILAEHWNHCVFGRKSLSQAVS